MGIKDTRIIEKFMDGVAKYEGKIELIIENNIRLNLKSTLSQFVALGYLFEQDDLRNVQIISEGAADFEKLLNILVC